MRAARRLPVLLTGVVTVLLMVVAGGVAGTAAAPAVAAPPAAGAEPGAGPGDEERPLYLVTLRGPGTAGAETAGPRSLARLSMLAEQDRLLAAVDAPAPVYRWTTALNGFAVRLTGSQAQTLESDPAVQLVERNQVRPLAGSPRDAAGIRVPGRRSGGEGTVIGIVDTGIAPETPLFASINPPAGPTSFSGACRSGEEWDAADCNGKIAGARWYVEGFGADAVAASDVLSPRDTDGHGTQMASIAAGNADVPVRVGGERLGRYGGQAPDARVAAYKACWSAPDPDDDGCATADLVSAIDDATRDGVDVLSLSVGGPPRIDTVGLALLGAVEAGVVVTAAAGNGNDAPASHPEPWVATVGGLTGDVRRGRVVLGNGERLTGAMLSRTGLGPRPVVLAEDVPAASASPRQARVCAPGSLDAGAVAGAIVVCERGEVARVDKSRAVSLADGAGMVLVNVRRRSTHADVHAVPTVHLDARAGRSLVRWVERNPRGRVGLRPAGLVERPPQVAPWSRTGDVDAGVLKPDVVAPATGVLGAVPPGPNQGEDWGLVSGTSAATAHAAGVAAVLRSRDQSPAEVRSALVTAAAPVAESLIRRSGTGRVRTGPALRASLAYLVEPGRYRAWLQGRRSTLNVPEMLLGGGATSGSRTITNVSSRRLYFSSQARGFRRDVTVTPAAVRLGPGESATFTVRTPAGSGPVDDGYVLWRGADGSTSRIPVVVSR